MAMVVEGYSISALAREFGVSPRTVAKRLEGVPAAGKRGNATLYLLADAAPAILQSRVQAAGADEPLDLTAERARLAKFQADRTELEVATLRGELIPSETVKTVWDGYIAACRAKFIALPSQLAIATVGLTHREIEVAARDLVYTALTELADHDPDHYRRARHSPIDDRDEADGGARA